MVLSDTSNAPMKITLTSTRISGPFMALSAAGGIRPGVYAGCAERRHTISFETPMSAPFTGLLPAQSSTRSPIGLKPHAARRPVNGPPLTKNNIMNIVAPLQPGVNAGPNTACGGKGRKRPSGVLARISHHTGRTASSVPLLGTSSAGRLAHAKHCLFQAVAHRGTLAGRFRTCLSLRVLRASVGNLAQ